MIEITVAQKYGLWIRRSSVDMDGTGAPVDSDYLYFSTSCAEPFRSICERFEQINDYCFHQLVAAELKFRELGGERERLVGCSGTDGAELDLLDEDLSYWNANLSVTTKVVPIILVSSFLEWALRLIHAEVLGAPPQAPRGTSDIEFLLVRLEGAFQHTLSIDPQAMSVIHGFRNLRNAFAHGKWNTLHDQLEHASLRHYFGAVSSLLLAVEAAWEARAVG